MKLTRWIVAMNLVLLAIACAVAMKTDRDATRLMAWGLWQMTAGWAMMASAFAFFAWLMIKGRVTLHDVIMLFILFLIGLFMKTGGTSLVFYLRDLPGWTFFPLTTPATP